MIARALALAAVLLALAAAGADAPRISEEPSGDALVRLRGPLAEQEALAAAITPDRSYNPNVDVWRMHPARGESLDAFVDRLSGDPGVAFAQPNHRYVAAAGPDDPMYASAQHPYYAVINAAAGWDVETGDPSVIVAVLDDGVDIDHPELDSKIWLNTNENVNGVDDDANGCVDDLHGCNFLTDIPEADVQEGEHGTFVAGIIAAETDNGAGVAAVAPGVTIMPVVVLDEPGLNPEPAVGTSEGLAAGILYAARNGAVIINMSLTFEPEAGDACPEDVLIEAALQVAHDDYGVTLLAAAGNFNQPCVGFPASSQYVIAVGAAGPVTRTDTRAFLAATATQPAVGSHWGPEVDVAAPGVDLTSLCPEPLIPGPDALCRDPLYGHGSGTSFATPIVAGLAALLLSQDPSLSNDEVRERIMDTARDMPDEQNPNWDGTGMVDVGAALGAGSAFAVIDLGAASAAEIEFSLAVGDTMAPLCEATLWDAPPAHDDGIYGTFGAGECADYWPPSEQRPWSLRVSNSGRKAARLITWSATSGGTACSSSEPMLAPPLTEVHSAIDCAGSDGRVPGNDEPAGAIAVRSGPLPGSFRQDPLYATSAGDLPVPCSSSFSRSLWYRVPASGTPVDMAVDTFGTAFDTVLAVYEGPPDQGLVAGCSDDSGDDSQSRVVWRLDGVSDYYVMAAAFQTVPVDLMRVKFSRAAIPANDEPEGAQMLDAAGGSLWVQGAANSATSGAGDPVLSCAPSYGYSVWFEVSSAAATVLAADNVASDYNTVIGVFRQDASGLTFVTCNARAAPGINTSHVSWDAEAGERYLIVVGAYFRMSGGVLRLTVAPD